MAILKDIGIKIPKTDEEIAKDPFLILGFGINAYFDMMIQLSKMMMCITVFVMPLFYGYRDGQRDFIENRPLQNGLFSLTLGSFGGSSVLC